MTKSLKMTRRGFIGTSSVAAAGMMIVPSNVIAGLGHKAPSDKLNIAGVGIGGMGFGNLKNMESENIVALCDVDWDHSKRCFDYFPKAQNFGIGGRCTTKLANQSMLYWLQLPTTAMLL